MNHVMAVVVTGAGGLAAGYLARWLLGSLAAKASETQARAMLKDARRTAKSIAKEAEIQAKAEVIKAREEFEKSTKVRRQELAALEERIGQREVNLDRKVAMIDKKEHALDEKLTEAAEKASQLDAQRAEAEKLISDRREALQRVAGLSREDARKTLLGELQKEMHVEIGNLIRRLQEEARETSEREARNIVAQAIQRYASSHASEMMTSTVALPGDEMKGRIIGRDGRNIRSLEAATGVNILIDDTPEAVVISAFDPIRREVARQALETLISDGRIHPARIEEVVAKAEETINETIRAAGEEALYLAGIQNVDPDVVRMLGRLKYRTSYSQNVLQHALEVSHLMGIMAGELDLDVALAKRIGLFHDIGKALDHEVEGGHAVIGADFLKRHGESPAVVNAAAAHHQEVEYESLYAVLALAADAISSSRVGARAETSSLYVKRLEKLEEIANQFDGVRKSYAIQAGREVRVIVDPEKLDDSQAMVLARDVSTKIEGEVQYPGEIRVTVIRETRCVEYAR